MNINKQIMNAQINKS